jgi:hypothetical protein
MASHRRAGRIDEDAHAHRPRATDAISEIPECDTADGCAEHQRGREPSKPLATEFRREGGAEQAFGHRKRCDRHQSKFDTVKHDGEEGCRQNEVAL